MVRLTVLQPGTIDIFFLVFVLRCAMVSLSYLQCTCDLVIAFIDSLYV